MTLLYMYDLYYTWKHTYLVIYFKGVWNFQYQTTVEINSVFNTWVNNMGKNIAEQSKKMRACIFI